MGEAKSKAEIQRKAALKELERWIVPPTQDEAHLAAELSTMPRITVPRASAEDIRYMRMQPQRCHDNCLTYARLDPEGKSEVVFGWWFREVAFVSHSIIRRDGQLFCITPYEYDDDPYLEFIEDTSIRHYTENNEPKLYRNGVILPLFARINPEQMIAECKWVRDRILSGVPISQAIDVRDFRADS